MELQIFTGQVEGKARKSGSAKAELQIFTGPVERNYGSGTSDLHRPGRAEVELQIFTGQPGRVEGQVEWKCGSETSDLHRPGRAELWNLRPLQARSNGSAEAELQIFTGQVV